MMASVSISELISCAHFPPLAKVLWAVQETAKLSELSRKFQGVRCHANLLPAVAFNLFDVDGDLSLIHI